MKPGDILKKENHLWRVEGVHLGSTGQESVIEVESISHKPAWTGEWEYHPRMFIPEILLRDAENIGPAIAKAT
jgi:hypothetical protein